MTYWVKPWREVVERQGYTPGGRDGGAYTYRLSCGHIAIRKASSGYPKRVRCDECGMIPEGRK